MLDFQANFTGSSGQVTLFYWKENTLQNQTNTFMDRLRIHFGDV